MNVMISSYWEGEEGAEFEMKGGATFKVYTSVEAMHADPGIDTIEVAPGTYGVVQPSPADKASD